MSDASTPTRLDPALRVHDLHVCYGDVHALRGLSLTCRPGSVTGVIGPNGAGKSTLVNTLADLVRPSQGHVSILGRSYDDPADAAEIKTQTGFLVSGDALLEYLTGREFLDFLVDSFALGPEGDERAEALCAMLELDEYLPRVISGYSRGNRKKLATVAALVHDPRVLVLDEPFESLDPLSVIRLREHLRALADDGKAVLVTSHLLAALEEISDEVVVVHKGKAHLAGTLAEVRARALATKGGSALETLFRSVVAGEGGRE